MRPEKWKKMKNLMNARRVLGRSLPCPIAIAAFIASVVSPAVAQNRAEITGFFGYSFSEGIDVNRGDFGTDFITHVDVVSSIAYGGAVDFWVDDMTQVGFLFGLQDSSLGVKGSSEREVTGLNVYSYHGTATFHAGSSSSDVRPFFMFGLGATQYKPSDVMGVSFDGETQFSGTLGAGVKVYVNEKVGLSFTGRWTPTYIKSDPEGVYCSPYWNPWYPGGCVVYGDADYSNQFVLSGGITLRL